MITETKDKSIQVQRTGILCVSFMYNESDIRSAGYVEWYDEDAQKKLAIAVLSSVSDGRQYSVQVNRTQRDQPSSDLPRTKDTVVKWSAVVLLVHPKDCEPGEWCVAFEEGEGQIPYGRLYEPHPNTRGCAERVA